MTRADGTGAPTAPRARFGRSSTPGGDPRRSGAVLIFFAFFFLAFFGLFAVVVDLGIARTTQLQMQSSADVAALEGLAGRDLDPSDFAASDLARRQLASAFAGLVFDEDLDRSTAPDQFLLGAGPVLDNGVAGVDMPAGGLLVAGAPYLPALQTNEAANVQSGDLVAGTYESVDPVDPGRVDWHREASDYGRPDFVADASGTAFLARLRRTRPTEPLDRVPGVSSAGPTLPYLFGLGSGALSTPDADVYDPRRDGITVRAVAVADARRATAAGLAQPGFPGLAPVARDVATGSVRWLSFDEAAWIAAPPDLAFTVDVDGSGAVSGPITGAAVFGQAQLGGRLAEGTAQIPATAPAELAGILYASLHARDATAGVLRVRGFVAVQVLSVTVVPGGALRIQASKVGPYIAPRNATAQPTAAADAAFALPPPAGGDALLAPVLAR
ncbi:MAG: pilus assembly protein TadG-related protein [Planctomycetota bacterium]